MLDVLDEVRNLAAIPLATFLLNELDPLFERLPVLPEVVAVLDTVPLYNPSL